VALLKVPPALLVTLEATRRSVLLRYLQVEDLALAAFPLRVEAEGLAVARPEDKAAAQVRQGKATTAAHRQVLEAVVAVEVQGLRVLRASTRLRLLAVMVAMVWRRPLPERLSSTQAAAAAARLDPTKHPALVALEVGALAAVSPRLPFLALTDLAAAEALLAKSTSPSPVQAAPASSSSATRSRRRQPCTQHK